ncbi:hypothetical protein EYC82_00535 [Halieaceae bacterium IMCC11814]|uniref:Uncharacterized protein n=1 Tax=Candidatus Marimicrobium litorale TaxID=2518991 RepID=A0ABT3T2U0_9GAMM|nr:hypothetical protein [Candidatus Marimicrobium litorale]
MSKLGAESARSGLVICAAIAETDLRRMELAPLQCNLRTAEQPNSRTAEQPNSRTAEQPNSRTAEHTVSRNARGD